MTSLSLSYNFELLKGAYRIGHKTQHTAGNLYLPKWSEDGPDQPSVRHIQLPFQIVGMALFLLLSPPCLEEFHFMT